MSDENLAITIGICVVALVVVCWAVGIISHGCTKLMECCRSC